MTYLDWKVIMIDIIANSTLHGENGILCNGR